MKGYDPYFLVDKEYEEQQEQAEQREEWEAQKVRDILSEELDSQAKSDIFDYVENKVIGFTDEQCDMVNDLLIRLALGETITQKDSHDLLNYSEICEVVAKTTIK